MIYIAIFLILVLFLSVAKINKTSNGNNQNKPKETPVTDVGMYFMNLHQTLEKNRSEIPNKKVLLDYYWTLGCASQGRVNEVKAMFKECKNTPLEKVFNQYSPQILKMAKIGKEVDDKPIGHDLKNGESVGEYFDRKVSKRPAYMTEFNFFKNLDIILLLQSTPTI